MMFMMMPSPRSTTTGRIVNCVRGFAVLLALFAAREVGAQSSVQGVPNAMQGFSQNRDQPIQIEAATLEMRDKKKEATFSGNVKVIQGDTTMTSKTLVVYYESSSNAAGAPANGAPASGTPAPAASPAPTSAKAAPPAKGAPIPAATPGPGGASSIKKLVAQGNVVVTQKDQVVTGDSAVFDTKTNLVTMLGGVVLTQGKNVLRGDRLLVDMTTGVSRVESDSGRVQGLFQSSGQPGQPASGPLGLTPPPSPTSPASNKPK
jgi:lipopolysaccharide export system protein LptA